MKSLTMLTASTAVWLGLSQTIAHAHHSTNGIYDEARVVELTGEVKRWRFVNPHPTLEIEVVAADGQTQIWDVSYGGAAVPQLRRRGYTADTFKPGDVVVVRGFASLVQTAHGLLIQGSPTTQDGEPIPGR